MFDQLIAHAYILLALIAAIVFRKQIFAFLFPVTHLHNELVDVLPFVDPDSNRMVEIITFKRAKKGLNTETIYFTISQNQKVTLDDIAEVINPYFKTYYKSKYLYRALAIRRFPTIPELYIVVEFNSGTRCVNIFGDKKVVDDVHAKLQARFVEPRSIEITSVLGVGSNGFITDTSTVFKDKANTAMDSFYPFIEGGVEKLARDFAASPDNAMVLIGPWGTGKTTLIRTLMLLIEKERYGIINSTDALKDPSLIGWIKGLGNNSLVASEDSDVLVMARSEGNNQMAGLLNTLEGVIPTNSKLIISTNLENGVNKIDPALIRKGRTFKTIQFRPLTLDEANVVRKDMGLSLIIPQHSYQMTDTYTLSEALRWSEEEEVVPKKAFGLIPG